MAGPIQTAIGQALGAVAGAVALGKKFNDDERQAAKEEAATRAKEDKAQKDALQKEKDKRDADKALKEKHEAEAKKAEEKEAQFAAEAKLKKKAEKEEAKDVAIEADLINFGASPEAAKAYLLAQKRGIAAPKRILFDKSGKPMATYAEMAQLLADESLSDTYSSQLRTRRAVKVRRQLLEGKSHKERVESAVLAAGGKLNG